MSQVAPDSGERDAASFVASRAGGTRSQMQTLAESVASVLRHNPWLSRAVRSVAAYGVFRHTPGAPPGAYFFVHRFTLFDASDVDRAQFDQGAAQTLAGVIAHEIGHALDNVTGQAFVSESHHAFSILGDGATRRPFGNVMQEAARAFLNGPEPIWALLKYPFSHWAEEWRPNSFFKTELFAQLVSGYVTQRALLRRHLPKSYELVHRATIEGWHQKRARLVGGEDRVRAQAGRVANLVHGEAMHSATANRNLETVDYGQQPVDPGQRRFLGGDVLNAGSPGLTRTPEPHEVMPW